MTVKYFVAWQIVILPLMDFIYLGTSKKNKRNTHETNIFRNPNFTLLRHTLELQAKQNIP
jgi:hypothetical protein